MNEANQPTTVTVRALLAHFHSILDQAQRTGEPVIIAHRRRQPAGVLQGYEAWEAGRAKLAAERQRGASLAADLAAAREGAGSAAGQAAAVRRGGCDLARNTGVRGTGQFTRDGSVVEQHGGVSSASATGAVSLIRVGPIVSGSAAGHKGMRNSGAGKWRPLIGRRSRTHKWPCTAHKAAPRTHTLLIVSVFCVCVGAAVGRQPAHLPTAARRCSPPQGHDISPSAHHGAGERGDGRRRGQAPPDVARPGRTVAVTPRTGRPVGQLGGYAEAPARVRLREYEPGSHALPQSVIVSLARRF